jgi:hypothetical protein
MRHRFVFAALLLSATPALAGNLLSNPTFDTDLSGWAYVGTGNWDASDALAQANSGSVVGTNSSVSPFTYETVLVSACLPVNAGAGYDSSLDSRIPSGQGLTVNAFLEVAWYSQAGCSGLHFLGANSIAGNTTADGLWHRATSNSSVTAPAAATHASVRVHLAKTEAGGTAAAYFDNLVFKPQGTCAVLPDLLCLNNGRFQVSSRFEDYSGQTGVGLAQAMTGDTGYFWFFSAANVEVVLKVIDGCGYNSSYWVYAGGLTDVEVQLLILDTRSGATWTRSNVLGTPFQPIGDIQAFATCP